MSIILDSERKNIEYKRQYTKNVLKTVSAFSNFYDGEIVIGVDDNLKIVGLSNPMEAKLNIENAINDNIKPRPYYEIYEEIIKGKIVIVIKVFSGENTPYLYNKKAYKRADTSTVPVDRYDYERLILKGRNQGYDELPYEGEDLNFEYLNKKLRERLRIGVISEDILKTLALIKNDRYTNSAALLADNNPISGSAISLVRFEGNTVANIRDRLILEDVSILEVYDKAVEFYHKHINISEIIKGAYRKTVEEVPLVAYREALANCIVHRDYMIDVDSRIEIFNDRVEIISSGGLPLGITEEEYLEGRISIPRNKIIADIFLRLGIIERLATGVRRIREYYKDYELQPEFIVRENTITVILPNIKSVAIIGEAMDEYVYDSTKELSKEEKLIVDYILRQGKINRKAVEELLNLKKTFSVKMLNQLIDKGLIKKIGKGKSTHYILAKPMLTNR